MIGNVAVVAAAAEVTILVKGILDYRAGQQKAKVATDETTKVLPNTMKWLILKHLTLPQGDPNFIDKIFNVIKVKAFNDNFAGFVDELKKSDDNINQLTRSSAKFGGVLIKIQI